MAHSLSSVHYGILHTPGEETSSTDALAVESAMPLPPNESTTRSLTFPASPPKQNLPFPLTSFVGREQEMTALTTLLRCPTARLLTLTGPAGVGKTRLSLQAAAELTSIFADGVCFVSLASLRDPHLVLPALAQALRLPEARGRPPLESLQAALREHHLLLLLDNFEQVAEAAPLLIALLQSCPKLKIIVTSRALLRVRGECEMWVPPLDLPDLQPDADPEALAHNTAVTLFTQRVQAMVPDFTLTGSNIRTIAEICVRLDGLPLALELAAARITLLSPHQLLSRLEHRLETLTSGAHDLPARQQTLRTTLQWSYDLLSPAEQGLFRLLAVFVGGCTLEAVEALSQALHKETTAVLDGLQRLLDTNLIFKSKQRNGEMRLRILETIREYAQVQLTRSGEAEEVQHAHAEYYLALVEEAQPRLFSSEQLPWLERLEQEYKNQRVAVQYLLQHAQYELVLRLTAASWFFWALRAHLKEGQHWLEEALAGSGNVSVQVRAKALYAAASTHYFQGQWESARILCEDSLRFYRQVGDKRGIATALNRLGHLAFRAGHTLAVKELCEESLLLCKEVQDGRGIAEALFLSSYRWYAQGAYAQARTACEQSLAIVREIGDRWATAYVQQNLGYFAYRQGDYALARTHYQESLQTCKVLREPWITAPSLAGLGEVAATQGQFAWAARLWGATELLCETLGTALVPIDRTAYERAMATTRRHLGEEAFATLWMQGRTMPLDQVLTEQDAGLPPQCALTSPASTAAPASVSQTKLTSREREVICLLAQGLTSAQIARQLVISIVTVNFHVRSIYSKLGISSRSAATRYAIEHHLV